MRAGDVVSEIAGQTVPPDGDLADLVERCCRELSAIELIVARNEQRVSLSGSLDAPTNYGPVVPLFPRRRPSGRVDLVKSGNTVRATTSGVAEFTLLLSPDAFDFERQITVVTNGVVSVHEVTRSLATLLKWAAVENDRTMLFGAELRIRVN